MLEASEILSANLLIVDDQEANVMLLEKMLRSAGYTGITSTMDSRTVCALHRAHRYDLILLDLQMPNMDGFAVMDGLREIETDGYLPVLVITAQPGHKMRALEGGAKDFVSKPFDLLEVKTRIHNMLEVRLLYRKLDNYNKVLQQTVMERTAELRESEARFQRFTELSSDWYWEQDSEGKLTRSSGPVPEMLGIGREAVPDAPDEGWNASERALLDANIAARRPFIDFVYSHISADGARRYLQVSGEPMFDPASRFIGYRGVGMDITDRILPNSEELRLRGAIDMIDQGLCLLDYPQLRVIDVNDTVCRLSGYSRQELLSTDLARFGIGSKVHLTSVLGPLVDCAAVYTHDADLRRKDGATFRASITWRSLQINNNSLMVGVVTAVPQ